MSLLLLFNDAEGSIGVPPEPSGTLIQGTHAAYLGREGSGWAVTWSGVPPYVIPTPVGLTRAASVAQEQPWHPAPSTYGGSASGIYPTIDGNVTNAGAGGNPATVTLTTTNPNDLIILISTTGVAVTSISDNAGLAWNRYTTTSYSGSVQDIWYAVSPGVLTADVISVTYTGSVGYELQAFGVANADTANPFNGTPGSFTYTGSPTGGPAVTTTVAGSMVVGALNQNTEQNPVYGAGWNGLSAENYCLAEYQTGLPIGTYAPTESPNNSDIWLGTAFAISPASGVVPTLSVLPPIIVGQEQPGHPLPLTQQGSASGIYQPPDVTDRVLVGQEQPGHPLPVTWKGCATGLFVALAAQHLAVGQELSWHPVPTVWAGSAKGFYVSPATAHVVVGQEQPWSPAPLTWKGSASGQYVGPVTRQSTVAQEQPGQPAPATWAGNPPVFVVHVAPVTQNVALGQEQPGHPLPLSYAGSAAGTYVTPTTRGAIVAQEQPGHPLPLTFRGSASGVYEPSVTRTIVQGQEVPWHPLPLVYAGNATGEYVAPGTRAAIVTQEQPWAPAPWVLSARIVVASATVTRVVLVGQEQPGHPLPLTNRGAASGQYISPAAARVAIVGQEQPSHPLPATAPIPLPTVPLVYVSPATARTPVVGQEAPPHPPPLSYAGSARGQYLSPTVARTPVVGQEAPPHPLPATYPSAPPPLRTAPGTAHTPVIGQELPWHPAPAVYPGSASGAYVSPAASRGVLVVQEAPPHPLPATYLSVPPPLLVAPGIARWAVVGQEQPPHPPPQAWKGSASGFRVPPASRIVLGQEQPGHPSPTTWRGAASGFYVTPAIAKGAVVGQEQPPHPPPQTAAGSARGFYVAPTIARTVALAQEQPWSPVPYAQSAHITWPPSGIPAAGISVGQELPAHPLPLSYAGSARGQYVSPAAARSVVVGQEQPWTPAPFVSVVLHPAQFPAQLGVTRQIVLLQEQPWHPPSALFAGTAATLPLTIGPYPEVPVPLGALIYEATLDWDTPMLGAIRGGSTEARMLDLSKELAPIGDFALAVLDITVSRIDGAPLGMGDLRIVGQPWLTSGFIVGWWSTASAQVAVDGPVFYKITVTVSTASGATPMVRDVHQVVTDVLG